MPRIGRERQPPSGLGCGLAQPSVMLAVHPCATTLIRTLTIPASLFGCSSAMLKGASSIIRICCSPACAARGPDADRLRSDWIPLPRGSDLFTLPGRAPVGLDPRDARAGRRRRVGKAARRARSRRSSRRPTPRVITRRGARGEAHRRLPLYAYTAVGWADDQYWTSAFRSDDDRRQDPWRFSQPRIEAGVAQMKIELPRNRVARQLERCALEYGCRAAQNFFLGRHEGPLPVSIACNAQCVGCISLQPDGEFRASHDRLEHRTDAARGGRRGARALRARAARRGELRTGLRGRADALRRDPRRGDAPDPRCGRARHDQPQHQRQPPRRGARALRRRARRDPRQPELAAPEGLRRLLQPARLLGFADVEESIATVVRAGGHASINLLCFPGVTDTDAELDALVGLDRAHGAALHPAAQPESRSRAVPPRAAARDDPAGSRHALAARRARAALPRAALRVLQSRRAKRAPSRAAQRSVRSRAESPRRPPADLVG